jgi:hypothetical protein
VQLTGRPPRSLSRRPVRGTCFIAYTLLGVDIIAARISSQGLSAPAGDARSVLGRLVGLQAQDDWIAPYAIRPRAATVGSGATVVSWLMRGTLHMVDAQDAWWLVELLGPHFAAKGRPRRLQLGLTDSLLATAVPALVARLPASRTELLSELAAVGVPAGQARAHALAYAGLTGELCILDGVYARVPAGRKVPKDRMAELARRYLVGYGPATVQDFAAWSGLPHSLARPAFDSVSPATFRSGPVPRVRLLGHFDPYLLGYKDRSFALDPAHAKDVQRGGGFLRPIVLVDGVVAGTWSRTWRGSTMDVSVSAWAPVPAAPLAAEIDALNETWWRPVVIP